MNANDSTDDPRTEAALRRACQALPRELEPARDLWPGIERRIAPMRRTRLRWRDTLLVAAAAASFLMAGASLTLVLWRDPRNLAESFEQVDADYLVVRQRLLVAFERSNAGLDPAILEPVYRNLDIIDGARGELQLALRADPQNQRLLEMLIRLRQQEIEILQQEYAAAVTSL